MTCRVAYLLLRRKFLLVSDQAYRPGKEARMLILLKAQQKRLVMERGVFDQVIPQSAAVPHKILGKILATKKRSGT